MRMAPALLAGTAKPTKDFTESYESLRVYVRWYEWGDQSISQIATRPGEIGADHSPLSKILADANHRGLRIPVKDPRRIYLWLDANAPFYGTDVKPDHVAQRSGAMIEVPTRQ